METTRLSTKGQIILPKAVRTARAWKPGTEFTVEETAEGIILRPVNDISESELDQVARCLKWNRKTKTVAQMDTAVRSEVIRRHDRGR